MFLAVTEMTWECFGASCYYMPSLKTPQNKTDADATCGAMGAHVMATETPEENDMIKQLVFGSGKQDAI
jgi:hypothetical protein